MGHRLSGCALYDVNVDGGAELADFCGIYAPVPGRFRHRFTFWA